MNGKVQGIIVCGVVCACLGGTMLFLNSKEDGNSSSDSSSSQTVSHKDSSAEEKLAVLNADKANIKSVHIKNAQDEFTLENPLSGKSNPYIDKLDGVNQNSGLITNMLDNSAVLEASKLAEDNAGDLKKYGLEKPSAQFTVEYTDGKKTTAFIGDESVDGKYYYLKIDGENKIYMVQISKLAYYTGAAKEFVSNQLIEAVDENSNTEYGSLTVSRTDLDYKMIFENDPTDNSVMASAQVMTSPIFGYLDVNNSTSVTHGMFGLTASGCEVIKPSDKDVKKYGLDKPRCTVEFKGKDYNYTLNVGDPVYDSDEESSEGTKGAKEIVGYYCTVKGVEGAGCVYKISAASLPWVTVKPDDVIADIMIARFLVDLESVTIDHNGDNYSFEFKSNGSSDESTDENGETVDTQSVKLNGKDIDVDNFKSFYQYMIACPTGEIYFKEPKDSDKYMTLTVNAKNGEVQKLEYYKESARRSVVKINGKTSYRIENTWVDTLIKNAENLKDGKPVNDTY